MLYENVIASGAKQSRKKRHDITSNSGLLRFARNDVKNQENQINHTKIKVQTIIFRFRRFLYRI